LALLDNLFRVVVSVVGRSNISEAGERKCCLNLMNETHLE